MSIDRAILFRLATSSRLERVVRAAPCGEDLAWRAASRYVAGRTTDDAHHVVEELHGQGVASSIDQFGEFVENADGAAQVGEDYRGLAAALAGLPEDTWLSMWTSTKVSDWSSWQASNVSCLTYSADGSTSCRLRGSSRG